MEKLTDPADPADAVVEPPEQEKKPLVVKPKPPAGKRLNKRLLGVGILVLGTVLLVVVYGIKRRGDASTGETQKTGPTTEAVQAVPKAEANTLLSSIQKPNSTVAAPGATNQPGSVADKGNPPATQPSSLPKPPWQPASAMQDTSGFQRSFYAQPGGQVQPGQQARPETRAEEAARLEHEALYAPLTARAASASSRTGSALIGVSASQTVNPVGAPGSDIDQIAALEKSLIGAAAQAAPGAPPAPTAPVAAVTSSNSSGGAGAFAQQREAHRPEDDSLSTLRIPPLSPYEIKAGWEIPAMLEQELKSDLPGELRALVTQNVRDTAHGQYILIPQGSRLIGAYNNQTTFGQGAVEVVWTRIIFPDASSLDLGGMIGQDEKGQAGLSGKTNNHYGQLVTGALLTSVLSAASSLANNRSGSGIGYYPSWETAAGAGAGQSIQQTGSQITQRNLNRRPTVVVAAGTRFNVHVNKDIRFDGAYTPRPALLPGG